MHDKIVKVVAKTVEIVCKFQIHRKKWNETETTNKNPNEQKSTQSSNKTEFRRGEKNVHYTSVKLKKRGNLEGERQIQIS